VALAKGEEKA